MRKQDRRAETEAQDAKTVDHAIEVLQRLDLEEVERLLLPVIAHTPRHYVNEYEKDGKRYIKFWDRAEFTAYSTRQTPSEAARIVWLRNAYPRAHYYMAYLSIERQQPQEAIRWLDAGMKLEPAQPRFRIEKANALSMLRRHAQALSMCDTLLEDGMELTPSIRAHALRGRGVQLIELGELDEAEQSFLESLEHDPDNPRAQGELEYIHRLRSGEESVPVEMGVTGPKSAGLACAVCGMEVLSAPDSADKVVCEGCTQRGSAVLDCGCIANQVLGDGFEVIVVKDPCTADIEKKDVIQVLVSPDADQDTTLAQATLHALYFGKTAGRESGPPLKYADTILSGLAPDKGALLAECRNVEHAAVAAMARNIVRRGKH